jgi:hypothetical protein
MNWEVAGTIADILAAATVVISVLYLAKQVRDAADTNIAETNHNIAEALNSNTTMTYKDWRMNMTKVPRGRKVRSEIPTPNK